MSQSESIQNITAALVKAQAQMENAVINKENPHFRSKYADLPAVRAAALPLLNANGIAVSQKPLFEDGVFKLVTMLVHESGEWMRGDYLLPMNGRPQEIGSAITYARRYSIAAMVFISADEDDDANAAEAAHKAEPVRTPPKPANDNKPFVKLEPVTLPFNDDFVSWGTRLAAQITASTSKTEVNAWLHLNQEALELAKKNAPKVYARLKTLADGSDSKVDQQQKKTDARPTGTAKSAADDLETFRLLLLAATTERELDGVWDSFPPNMKDRDRAVEMYEARRKQLKAAA